eukprot:452198-Rhodomonas_salina.2
MIPEKPLRNGACYADSLVAPYAMSVPGIAYRARRQIAGAGAYAMPVPEIAYRERRQIAVFTWDGSFHPLWDLMSGSSIHDVTIGHILATA